jgi:hypothetical protein
MTPVFNKIKSAVINKIYNEREKSCLVWHRKSLLRKVEYMFAAGHRSAFKD